MDPDSLSKRCVLFLRRAPPKLACALRVAGAILENNVKRGCRERLGRVGKEGGDRNSITVIVYPEKSRQRYHLLQ